MRRSDRRRACIATLALVASAVAVPPHAAADTPVADFAAAWAAVGDYTATITVHEINGNAAQDNVYRYAYKKPHFAKIDVVSGPGRGSGAVWTGGDTVRGHMGGFLSGIKQTVSIHDRRATSPRGDTIDHASFQSVADEFATGSVEAVTSAATVDGVAATVVTVDVTPAAAGDITKLTIALSNETHLPVRRTAFVGAAPVKTEDFSDVRTGAGLTEADFT